MDCIFQQDHIINKFNLESQLGQHCEQVIGRAKNSNWSATAMLHGAVIAWLLKQEGLEKKPSS